MLESYEDYRARMRKDARRYWLQFAFVLVASGILLHFFYYAGV